MHQSAQGSGGGCRKGLTALILRELKKRSLTHSELLIITGLAFRYLDIHMRGMLRVKSTYLIDAGEWFKNKSGEKDRIYRLAQFNGKVKKKTTVKNSPLLYGTRKEYRTTERRKVLSDMAQARAKLIAEGNYSSERERYLCKIFGVK